jgi:phosphatidylglycerol lysyltransferase
VFHGEGYLAYVDTGRAWVAAGAPVCPAPSLPDLVQAFLEAARASGRRCSFFGVEPRLLAAAPHLLQSLQLGAQPVWDPQEWQARLRGHASLREQLRRARAKGVTVQELSEGERRELSAPLDRLQSRWLASRNMPAMGFLVAVPPAYESIAGTCFVAWHRDTIVGVASVLPVVGRGGWFVEHLQRDAQAPNGTVELLVDAVMRFAKARDSSWLTLGLAPLAGEVARPLQLARRTLGFLYDFEGLARFKSKFRPREWMPIHLAFPPTQGPFVSMYDALSAFAPGGMLTFGARFVLRGHPAVLGVLGALLLVWTVLLASASSAHWFHGHAAIKWAWVAFDLVVCAGIVGFIRRPSRKLAWTLAVLVSIDALLTPLEAMLWNVPRLTGLRDACIVLLACTAPLLGAAVLWGAAFRLRAAGRSSAKGKQAG